MATEQRLIDANELKDRFKLRIDWLERDAHDEYTTGLFHGAETDVELIDEMPTVDAVEVVNGRWIAVGGNHHTRISQCTKCCAKYDFRSNYCPNCGAKMDGDGNG